MLAALAALAVSLSAARGQQNWIGGVGSFDDSANWSGGFVPNGGYSIAIGNGGTAQSSGNSVETVSLGGGSTLQILAGISTEFSANEFYAGISGTGTLSIGSQALVATSDFYAGSVAGATGVVNMDGAYLSPFATYIGYAGTGTFVLTNGSTLQSTTGSVGSLAGSRGTIQLTDSTWKAEDQGIPVAITVGVQGIGEVEASGASLISALSLALGDSTGASGDVTLTGGTLTITNAIQVGNAGTGKLTLADSASATGDGVDIGTLASSTGTVSLTASSLSSTGDVNVGLSGNGTLETSGAQLHAPQIFVGKNGGSTGTATLTGGTTTLTGELHVGAQGHGTVTLEGGGTLDTDKGNMGYSTGATGTVNILNGTWNNAQAIFVGVSGSGTLTTGAAGVIASESGYIAQDAGGVGTVTMNGGSWTMTNTLAVGVNGTGEFSAATGAAVTSEWAQVGLHEGSSGVVTVDNSSWTTSRTLTIGSAGDGEFHALNGANVTAGSVELAATNGVTASLTVTDSTLTTENVIAASPGASVEFSGAQLRLLGGASVVDTLLIEGFGSGAAVIGSGGLTVDTQGGNAQIASGLSGAGSLAKVGAGRLRLNTANSFVGGTSIQGGVLEIANGASLGTGATSLGTAELRAIANLTLSGGSSALTIGGNQTATFSATTGQTLTIATAVTVGAGATMAVGSTGNAGAVVFAPSELTTPSSGAQVAVRAGTLTAGNGRLAQLTALADGTTVAAGATLDFQDHTGGGIRTLLGAGTVNTGASSATTLTVKSGNFSGNISGAGALVKETGGTLVLSGQNAFTGGTTVNAGALIVDGSLSFGFGSVQVNGGATLGGSGIVGTIFLNGGTVAPGSSAGITLTSQNFYWTAGALLFDLGPTPTTSDLLATGSLEGLGTTYEFTFVDRGLVVGSIYQLITFVDSDIALEDFRFTNGGGFDGQFSYNAGALEFTVTAVPEPSTTALAVATLLGAVILLRRRQKFLRR